MLYNYTSVSESVCGDVQVARDLGMPVMLPSWVDHCWTAGLDSCISALDSDIVRVFVDKCSSSSLSSSSSSSFSFSLPSLHS